MLDGSFAKIAICLSIYGLVRQRPVQVLWHYKRVTASEHVEKSKP
jgi:hypothetical protein